MIVYLARCMVASNCIKRLLNNSLNTHHREKDTVALPVISNWMLRSPLWFFILEGYVLQQILVLTSWILCVTSQTQPTPEQIAGFGLGTRQPPQSSFAIDKTTIAYQASYVQLERHQAHTAQKVLFLDIDHRVRKYPEKFRVPTSWEDQVYAQSMRRSSILQDAGYKASKHINKVASSLWNC